MNNFIERLKKAVEERGVHKQNIAHEAKLSPQQLSHYLTGRSNPKWETVERLAKALRVNPFWLKFGIDDPFEQKRAKDLQNAGVTLTESAPLESRARMSYSLATVSERGHNEMPFSILDDGIEYVLDPRAQPEHGSVCLLERGGSAMIGRVSFDDDYVFIITLDQANLLRKFERDAVRLTRAVQRIESL